MATRRLALLLATLFFASGAFAKDIYLSITGTVGNFRTDARVFNPSATKDIEISATFLPVGNGSNAGAQPVTFTLAKRQMRVLDDVVTALFNTTGLGAIRLSSSDDFVATARIYAQTATGTLGQFVPGLEAPAQAISKGVLIQLKSNAAFRTNIGAVNPNATAANVTWRLYDRNNALIATGTPVVMSPFAVIGPTNMAAPFFFTTPAGADLSDAWVSYQSDQPIFAYASVIDNTTTDPTFIPAQIDSGETIVTPPPPSEKVYNVTVRSFEILFSPAPDLKVGDKVTLNIVNTANVTHGFSVIDPRGNPLVPAMSVPANQPPIVKTFTVGSTGEYTAFCTLPPCGVGHDSMFTSFTVGTSTGNDDRPGY